MSTVSQLRASHRQSAGSLQGRVLVVDDNRQGLESMVEILKQAGHDAAGCPNAAAALKLLQTESYEVVVTDLQMPGMSGLEFIKRLDPNRQGIQVVVVTAYASIETAVEAMRHGALDYLEKPFGADELEQRVCRALQHGRLLDQNRGITTAAGGVEMIGESESMCQLRQRISQVAPTSETVLIVGETGTGKELVAKSIHTQSRRHGRPLVSVNCPVLASQLAESELFGHTAGAFTGADSERTGRFELAHQGTIHLDEITEIDLSLQAKLLRVLQEQSFERVGASETIHVDVRIIASTNRDLHQQVAESKLREDLYYRLAVVPLCVPALRNRREDIPLLVERFLAAAAERLGREPVALAPCAAQLMLDYHWPGNVRELENIVTRASVLSVNRHITADEVGDWLISGKTDGDPRLAATTITSATASSQHARGTQAGGERHAFPTGEPVDTAGSITVGLSLQEMERKLIEATLEQFGGHRANTAKALGIGVRTLSGKLRAYGYPPRANQGGLVLVLLFGDLCVRAIERKRCSGDGHRPKFLVKTRIRRHRCQPGQTRCCKLFCVLQLRQLI